MHGQPVTLDSPWPYAGPFCPPSHEKLLGVPLPKVCWVIEGKFKKYNIYYSIFIFLKCSEVEK